MNERENSMPAAYPIQMTAEELLEHALDAFRRIIIGNDEQLLLTIVGLRSVVGLAHKADSYALSRAQLNELTNAVAVVRPIIEDAVADEMPVHRSQFAFFAARIVIEAFGREGDGNEKLWSTYSEAVEHVALIACELEMIYRRQNLGKRRAVLPARWRFITEQSSFNLTLH